jgi:hypothetical protein
LRFRNQHVNPNFLEGGRLRDYSVNSTLARAGGLVLSGALQYEHWAFPLLATGAKSNFTANIEIAFRPKGGRLLWRRK